MKVIVIFSFRKYRIKNNSLAHFFGVRQSKKHCEKVISFDKSHPKEIEYEPLSKFISVFIACRFIYYQWNIASKDKEMFNVSLLL